MLTGLGALQLVLDNGDRLLRLEVASQLAASLTEKTGGIVTQHKLLAILNAPPFDSLEIGAQEDPHPDLFIDCLTLPSGSWRVFPGISDGYPFIVEHLGLALWHIEEVRHRPWAEEGRRIITAALRISDRVAEKAGLQRGTRVAEPHRAAVGATRAGEFERLRAAVCFSMAEVHDILHDIEDLEPTLARLLARPGEHPFDGGLETFAGFPFCRCSDSLVVHLPHLILPALRHSVVSMAVNAGDAGAIAVAYARAVWDTCCRSLGRLGNEYETAIDLGPLAGRGARAATFSLDVDKKLCAIMLPDHLDAYDEDNVFHPSSEPDVTKPFRDAVALCRATLEGEQPLFLFIHQGIGRDTQVDMGKLAAGPAVFFNADQLRVISWIAEHRDPLALWYFAVANERASKAGVRGHSSFDMYAFYRKHKQSFYFGDEAAPGWAMLQPGFGREIREHLQERCDWHGARRPSDPVFHNLTSWQSQANTWPLYTPMLSIGEQVWVLVEGLRVPVWVVGSRERSARLYHHYAVLAETVAYWIWQSTPELNDILGEPVANAPWTVWLYLRSSDTWETGRFPDQYRLPAVEVDVRPAQGSMCLFVEPALATLALRDDNVADRELLAALLEGFSRLLPSHSPLHSSSVREQVVDRVAPQGMKKYFIVFDSTSQDLDSSGLPSPRGIVDAAEQSVLDDLGVELGKRQWSSWPVARARRSELLRDAVGVLYDKLVHLVETLCPARLVETLIARDEALVQRWRYSSRTLGYKTECHGRNSQAIAEFATEISKSGEAAMASRFLVEFVAAAPPTGTRPLSLAIYDELLALASTIINVGMESELLHLRIADFDVGVLPSGRYGADRAALQAARQQFVRALAGDEIARSVANIPGDSGDPAHSRMARLDRSSAEEFGCSLIQLLRVFGVAAERGRAFNDGVGIMRRSEFLATVAAEVGLAPDVAERAVSSLCLSPRPKFLQPPAPYSADDVYPWRFNRALSYMRRPLVLRPGSDGDEVVFGKRHVLVCAGHLVELCLSGRLKAQTIALKQAISDVRNEITEAFNDQVADVLDHRQDLVVRRRLRKIGGSRIGGPRNDLGDIDVLVADRSSNKLLALECKMFSLSRTPREMANELEEVFLGSATSTSVIVKHQRRADWLRAHTGEVLAELGLPAGGTWRVEAAIVVDRPLIAAYVARLPMPVLTIDELRQSIA